MQSVHTWCILQDQRRRRPWLYATIANRGLKRLRPIQRGLKRNRIVWNRKRREYVCSGNRLYCLSKPWCGKGKEDEAVVAYVYLQKGTYYEITHPCTRPFSFPIPPLSSPHVTLRDVGIVSQRCDTHSPLPSRFEEPLFAMLPRRQIRRTSWIRKTSFDTSYQVHSSIYLLLLCFLFLF